MKTKLKKDKNKTMTEQVYDKLEKLIIFCKIEPGTILTEAEIAEMVGAGRTPVREALRMLTNESLVSISRIGISIPEMSSSTHLQLLEIRRAILKMSVEKSIERLTELDKKSIKDLLDIIDNQDDFEFLDWLNLRHKVLSKCSKNKFVYQELRNVQGLAHRFWYFYAKEDDHKQGKRLHKRILEEVLVQNIVGAIEAVNELLDYLEDFTRKHSL
jgi:DNA-binding GntR family transcriptional regulator